MIPTRETRQQEETTMISPTSGTDGRQDRRARPWTRAKARSWRAFAACRRRSPGNLPDNDDGQEIEWRIT
jgi:hypothetical protein